MVEEDSGKQKRIVDDALSWLTNIVVEANDGDSGRIGGEKVQDLGA